jgi:hypothetical protein
MYDKQAFSDGMRREEPGELRNDSERQQRPTLTKVAVSRWHQGGRLLEPTLDHDSASIVVHTLRTIQDLKASCHFNAPH